MIKKILYTILLSILYASQSYSSQLKGEITDYGIYDVTKPKIETLPGSVSGKAQVGNGVLLKKTSYIPLIKNTFFGFYYKISGFKNNDKKQLKVVVKHPPIIKPSGKVTSSHSYQYEILPNNGVIFSQSGYVLNREYEMVTGRWSFQIWHQGNLMLEQVFTTAVNEKL